MTAQTKSGSNAIHGTGFFYRRSDWTAGPRSVLADPNRTQLLGVSSHLLAGHQFGGTIGGAIIKDKLFFFGDYQGTRQSNGVSGLFTVPTHTALTLCDPSQNTDPNGFCDLSEYLTTAAGVSGGGQVYDPLLVTCKPGPDELHSRTIMIPIGRISPAAAKILALFPDRRGWSSDTEQLRRRWLGSLQVE